MKKRITLFMTGLLIVMLCPMSVFANPNMDVYSTSERNNNTTYTVSIDTNGKAAVGISEITFDANALSCEEDDVVFSEDIDMYSVNVTDGTVRICYISEEPIKAGNLFKVTFEVAEEYANKEVSAKVYLTAFDQNNDILETGEQVITKPENPGNNNSNDDNKNNNNNDNNGNKNEGNSSNGNNSGNDLKLDVEKPDTTIVLPIDPPTELETESVPTDSSVTDNSVEKNTNKNTNNTNKNNVNNDNVNTTEEATEETVEETTQETTQEVTEEVVKEEAAVEETQVEETMSEEVIVEETETPLASEINNTNSKSAMPFVICGVVVAAAAVVGATVVARKKAKQEDK